MTIDVKYGPFSDNNVRDSWPRCIARQIPYSPKLLESSLARKMSKHAPSTKTTLTFDVLNLFLCNFAIFALGQTVTEKYKFVRGSPPISAKIIECLLKKQFRDSKLFECGKRSLGPWFGADL